MVEMTSRERWLAIFAGQEVDRVPTDIWATSEVHERLRKDLGCADDDAVAEKLHIDWPRWAGPKCKVEHHPLDPQADVWGVRKALVDYGTGKYWETVHNPLAKMERVEDIHAFRWPMPEDWDYSSVTDTVEKCGSSRPVKAGYYEPFLLYCDLRGMEQSFEDLLLNPEIADAICGHIFDFFYEHNKRILEAGKGKVDIFYLAEDLGSQTGPLMSLDIYRRFLRENQKKMADMVKSYEAHVIYHTDGAAGIFLPDLVDYVGIEMLNPIQWRCPTMEREVLAEKYGKKIAFHSAIDNQQTLPYGTVEDVVQEVKECARIFTDCRWICGPCHNLQPVTPTANIVAMYETIHEIGKKR